MLASLPLLMYDSAMDLPPDIDIPRDMALWPPYLRWPMRAERIALEFKSIFNCGARRSRLAAFDKKWSIKSQESLSVRLAAREMQKTYGPARAIRAASLHFLPTDMASRAEIYQRNGEFQRWIDLYRSKFGLPPREQFHRPPSP